MRDFWPDMREVSDMNVVLDVEDVPGLDVYRSFSTVQPSSSPAPPHPQLPDDAEFKHATAIREPSPEIISHLDLEGTMDKWQE